MSIIDPKTGYTYDIEELEKDLKPVIETSSKEDNKYWADVNDGEISLETYKFTVTSPNLYKEKEYIIDAENENEAHRKFMRLYEKTFDTALINWSWSQTKI